MKTFSYIYFNSTIGFFSSTKAVVQSMYVKEAIRLKSLMTP